MAGAVQNKDPSPYSTFAKILASYHDRYAQQGTSKSQLDAPIPYNVVVDQDQGMLSALMAGLDNILVANKDSLGNGSSNGNGQMTRQAYESLLLEHRTWALIRAVYDNRLHRADPEYVPPSAAEQVAQSPYTTPEDLAQTIVNESSDLSLWAALLEHLQSRPLLTSAPPIESRHGYLPSTLRKAKQDELLGRGSNKTSLDPDFTLRDPHGSGLAGEDRTYQNPLLETLWDLVRHGELDQAIRVCEEGGEPWRAASLLGSRRWSMGGLTNESLSVSPLEGNRARALWKKSCRAIAKNATLSSSERSLYAALISDLPTLLPVCNTWEDQLWAHIQYRLESRIDRRWHELGGFWDAEDRLIGGDEDEVVEMGRGGLEEVFASIASIQHGDIAQASANPYYVAQKMIILGRTDVLLETFASRIPGLKDTVSPDLIGPLIRFFAHLVLVLRSLNEPVLESPANAILEAYLRVLEHEAHDPLVAMYAACLREGNGEESYARFLRTMDPDASIEDKRDALLRAKQYDLNVGIIAKETVRMILQETFASVPALQPGQPDITSFTTVIDKRDVHLIRSIEWLTIVPETRDEALRRSNDVARYFLALGQAHAAQALLDSLPEDLAEQDASDITQADEHAAYADMFTVFSHHEQVAEIDAAEPKETATKVEQHNYGKRLLALIEQVHDETYDLLTADWLRFDAPSTRSNYETQRRRELARIRQIFIPDLVLRLHALLMSHTTRYPALLQRVLDLTKIVAAEEFHVYPEFLYGDNHEYRLVAYLDLVRTASLEALERGSGNAFRAEA